MIKKANEIGIKIILDFVPNHTSDEHEWFIKSENREKGYEDLFMWDDGKVDPSNPNNRLPPSNWISVFRGSAWTWSSKRKQFYYHAFLDKQPDLNYRSPTTVQLMKNALKFWLDRGVAGFRVDSVPNLFEVAPRNGVYPDEPINLSQPDEDNYDHLLHVYVTDQPETIDMVYQWREVLTQHEQAHGGDERILMIETYSVPAYSNQMYGNKTTEGAQIPFNFNLITKVHQDTNAQGVVDAIDAWMQAMPSGKTANKGRLEIMIKKEHQQGME
uniref:alpha-glucosidase n=1 Tax=Megaselia scalaris TaxID=36166 RepID=T1GL30_MEGSC